LKGVVMVKNGSKRCFCQAKKQGKTNSYAFHFCGGYTSCIIRIKISLLHDRGSKGF
jgi:hypothetical protein